MRKRHHVQLAKRLSQPALLEESRPPLVLPALLILVTLLLAGGVGWASITHLNEVASTSGKIVPAGEVHRVQHVTGGKITAIKVDEGQLVKAGAPLVRLDATAEESNLGALRARRAGLTAKAARLRAFLNDTKPDFGSVQGYPDIVAEQRAALRAQKQARRSKRQVYEARIDRQQAKLDALKVKKKGIKKQIGLLEEAVKLRRDLSKKGLVSSVVLLDNERSLSRNRNQLVSIRGEIAETRKAIVQARSKLSQLEAKTKAEASSTLSDVQSNLAEVRERLRKFRARTRQSVLAAPVTGVVQGIESRTLGTVVEAGETVLKVVPVDDKMIAEVRLAPRDVGHVRKGQHAQVQLTSYDFARFGAIDGTVRRISATTFQGEKDQPFYKVRIGLERNHVGRDPQRNPVLPGMVVQANIQTGGKSLLKYLLHPVRRGLNDAFNER